MKKVAILLIAGSFITNTLSYEEYGSVLTSKDSITRATSKLIYKRFKNVPTIINKFSNKPEVLVGATKYKSKKEKEEVLNFIKEKNIKFLPTFKKKGINLSFKSADITVTTNLKDLLRNKFRVNGKEFIFKNELSFTENYERFKALRKERFSFMSLFIPSAHARIPSDNAYLAATMANSFELKMIFDTGKQEDIYCLNKELIKNRGQSHYDRCKFVADKMIRDNVALLSEQVSRDLKECNNDVSNKKWYNEMFSDFDPSLGLTVDMAPLEVKGDIYMAMNLYLKVSEYEREDQAAITDINKWIKHYFHNQYAEEDDQIDNIKKLSCKKLVDSTFKLILETKDYKEMAKTMCNEIEQLQTCHKELYNSTIQLRETVNDYSRKNGDKAPSDQIAIPQIRALSR
jgi:uncharacterized protein YdbL (DUF1318 family)